METQKPLLKDEDGKEVDVHMYRSMIGSLMYLTSSRPDIIFAVCACARYQVNPKVSHLYAVKMIFSDYAEASLDRKSTTGCCQLLGCRLISWQYKKQTVVAIPQQKLIVPSLLESVIPFYSLDLVSVEFDLKFAVVLVDFTLLVGLVDYPRHIPASVIKGVYGSLPDSAGDLTSRSTFSDGCPNSHTTPPSSLSRYHHPHLHPVTAAAAQPKEGAVGCVISIAPRDALALWQPPLRDHLVVSRSPRVHSVWYMHRPGCVWFLAAPPWVCLVDLCTKRVRVGLVLHRKGAVGFDLGTTR
ncbi:hypothetical protein Tco_1244145, partial [Tanacetum coccineum]